jgi:sec-independent protein translocase protein TatB
MFDFSLAEIVLIAVVAVVFIGPKDLPVVLRALAKAMAWVRGLTHEFRAAFEELSRESGVHEMRGEVAREVRQITGDDGEEYEAYDIADLLPPPPKDAP